MNTRQQDIIHLTEKHGEITIKDLAFHLGVSEMTIHRDLDYLQQERYLYKKRGAAVFIDNPERKLGNFYQDEKKAIGRKIASMLKPGQSILFDNSTTALECARYLDPSMDFIFYTTGMETEQILARYDRGILYSSGGYYFRDSRGYVGKQAEDFVSALHVDVSVIGASGISLESGITIPYPMHTSLQQKIISAADLCILGADHSKFGKVAIEKVAEFCAIHTIVTDSGISPKTLDEYRKVTHIIIAE